MCGRCCWSGRPSLSPRAPDAYVTSDANMCVEWRGRERGPGQTLCWSYDPAAWPAVVVGGYCFLAMALPSLTSPEWRRGSAQFVHLRGHAPPTPSHPIPSPETHIAQRPGKIRPTRAKGEHKCCNVAGHERVGAGGATLDCPARADSISQIMGDEEGPDNADRARV